MKFGVCADLNAAEALKKAGFDFIELNVGNHLVPNEPAEAFSEQLQKIKKLPLPGIAANSLVPRALKVTGAAVDFNALKRFIASAFSRAREAGIKTIVFGSGGARKIPEGFNYEKAWEQLVDFGSMIAPIAQTNDLTVALEPLNRKETNLVLSVSEGAKLVRAVNHSNLRLLVDSYHWTRENDSAEALMENGDLIGHVHIATYSKRLAPGLELCDFSAFVKALKSIHYNKGISIEAGWNNMELEAPMALAQIKRDFGL
jgi:sugar phosphate isomerase/epimerase